ncbi:DUF3394 domain-containing protein [Calditrichota bacterium]
MTAAGGGLAFASATQGWVITRNRWYETILLLWITYCAFRPFHAADLMHLPSKYLAYLVAILLWFGIYFLQRFRIRAENHR